MHIPIKFKDNRDVSDEIKKFIKKCLDVEENNRMTFEEIKGWGKGKFGKKGEHGKYHSILENVQHKLNITCHNSLKNA
jgi:hypothetical protein